MQKKVIQEDETLSAAERTQHINDIKVSGATIASLALDFTLPGYPDIELLPSGSQTAVTIWNLDEYIAKVMDFTLGKGVYRQVEAFQAGFSQVFPYAAIHAFTPDELVMLYGRVDEDWTMESKLEFYPRPR